jgi:hypothetical protein
MTFDLITILLAGGICLSLGVLAGFVIAYLFQPKQDQERPQDRRLVEVLRIWRNKRSGQLMLELDEQKFDSAGELSLNRHNNLVRILDELRLWLGAPEYSNRISEFSQPAVPVERISSNSSAQSPFTSPTGSAGNSTQKANPAPVQKQAEMMGLPAVSPTHEPPKTPQQQASLDERKPKVSFNPFVVLARAVTSDIPKDVSTPKSITAQIDEILQDRLALLPQRDKAIRLMEVPNRGVIVLIGLDSYDGINEVPDPEVKALLKECVMEWENRQTGQASQP